MAAVFVCTTVALSLCTYRQAAAEVEAETEAEFLVELIDFPTSKSVNGFQIQGSKAKLLERFRAAAETLPEQQVVALGLALAQSVGEIEPQQGAWLRDRLDALYAQMANDPAWAQVPSTLAYCFDPEDRREGQYLLVRPAELTAETPVVVLLHGYGGNFQSVAYWVSRALPAAVVLAPSWPETWADGPSWYVREALDHFVQETGLEFDSIFLMGVSDGGKAVAAAAARDSKRVDGVVSLVMNLPRRDLARLPRDLPVLMIAATEDRRVSFENCEKTGDYLQRRFKLGRFVPVEGDHFVLLDEEQNVMSEVRDFLDAALKRQALSDDE